MKKSIVIVAGAALLTLGVILWEKSSPFLRPIALPIPLADAPRVDERAPAGQGATAGAGSAHAPLPAPVVSPTLLRVEGGVDAFAPALVGAKFERQERRMFDSQPWETDLTKGLELKPGERLERRSGIYELPDMRYPKLRVDRVYRLGGVPAVAAAGRAPARKPATGAVGVTSAPAELDLVAAATAPLDNGGGELAWSNAMVADHLMVQAQPGISRERLAASLPAQCRIREQVTVRGLYLVEIPATGDRAIERAVLALNQLKTTIQFAEPDFAVTAADVSANDPLFTTNAADTTKQWHLAKTMAPRAWQVLNGPPFDPLTQTTQYQARLEQTVVAIVDTGFDYTHPDLAPAMWTNPGETGGGKETNNLDDDANLKFEDWRGWDFTTNDNDPMDDTGHGTHVAGIVGAVGNNSTGTTGVCWNVKLLNLRIIKKSGTGTLGYYSWAVGAMDYIRSLNQLGRKVAVANHSWGGNGYSLAMLNVVNNPVASGDPLPAGITGTYAKDVNQFTIAGSATERAKIKLGMKVTGTGIPVAGSTRGDTLVTIIEGTTITLSNYTTAARTNQALTFSNPNRPKQYGVVHVAAAGNSRQNADRIPSYPAALPSGMMISVGGSDLNDSPAVWVGTAGSNYGKLNVDIFAPGSGIWSTYWKPAAGTPPAGFIPVPASSTQGYVALNGTSMAAPQVAAAVALLRMWQPSLTDFQARQILVDQAEPVTALKEKCISGGRLSVARMMDKIYPPALLGSGGATSGTGTTSSALSSAGGITGKISAGSTMILATHGGKVRAWGENGKGQLGHPTTLTLSATPLEVPGLDDVVMVAAGGYTSFALRSDGTVWAWGENADGLLATGVKGGIRHTPAPISGLADVVWISASHYHALAVRGDGTIWAWGKNQYGEIGDDSTTERLVPVQVLNLTDMTAAEAGVRHSIALRSDGTVHCWGNRNVAGSSNPLGDGNNYGISKVPIQVPGISDVAMVDAADGNSLAIKKDGTVWWWGGLWNQAFRVPTQRPGLANVIFASITNQAALVMDADGRVFGWGSGFYGSLGNNSYATVSAFSGFVIPEDQAVVGFSASYGNAYALTTEGRLFAAGTNDSGRLGTGSVASKYYPVQLTKLAGSTSVTFGASSWGSTGFAVNGSGSIFQWGNIDQAQIDVPQETTFMSGATRIKLYSTCLFTKADGTLWGWGGIIGSSSTPSLLAVPAPVVDFAPVSPSPDSVTGDFLLALRNNAGTGEVYAWGNNAYGQLGDNTTQSRTTPGLVPGLPSISAVAVGSTHGLALAANGEVWAWGKNHRGQLGDASTTDSLVPKKIPSLSGIVSIAATGHASFAVDQYGGVWSWGLGGSTPGLGRNASTTNSTPIQVPTLPAIASISASFTTVALRASDGTVWAWGLRFEFVGRGITSPTPATRPAQVVGLSDVVEVVAEYASYARRSDGSVWAWGGGAGRTLGDGDSTRSLPVSVVGFGGASETFSSLGTLDTTSSWQFQNFSVPELLDDSLVADWADPDGDGVSNLLEYALGQDPRLNSAQILPTLRLDLVGATAQSESAGDISLFSLPTVDLTDGKHYQALTVNRNGIRQDIDYAVEVSADLATWQSGDPFTITVLNTAETLEVYDATAIEDAPQRFMRLRIQRK